MSIPMAPAKSLVLCAATSWEARPLAKGLGLAPSPSGAGRWEGTPGGHAVVLLQTGMGGRQAVLSLSRHLKTHDSVDILSIGFAGALRRGLEPGHLILDFPDSDLAARALSCAQRMRLDASLGATADASSVIATPEEKLRLGRETGALAVDMETKALKTWARERRLTAWAIRAVLDRVDDVLPPPAPRERSSKALVDYAVSHIRFLRSIPALAANRRRAIASLTMFFNAFLPELCR